MLKTLFPDENRAIHNIDGDNEDLSKTLARLLSYSLLPGSQIYRVTDSRIFHSKTVTPALWQKAVQSYQQNRTGPVKRNLHAMIQATGLKIDTQATLSEIQPTEWKKLFDFDKPGDDLSWADNLLYESRDLQKSGQSNITDQYITAFEKGIPPANILILTAETVDKRQKLFNYIKKNGTIVDCTVAAGSSNAAQNEQKAILKEMMLTKLAEYEKKIAPQAVDLFFQRVGFHPVAVTMETEKLAHYVGSRNEITAADLNKMVARNKEDALYELTDALGKRQLGKTLSILDNLIDQGVHSLAVLATLRNYLRKLLVFKSMQLSTSPAWKRGMSAKEFQSKYLPDLKTQGEWPELLSGHPYALYMNFTKASEYSCSGLKHWLILLLQAEFRLKGSSLAQSLILEELFIHMLKGSPKLPY